MNPGFQVIATGRPRTRRMSDGRVAGAWMAVAGKAVSTLEVPTLARDD